MLCNRCGTEMMPYDAFCRRCGAGAVIPGGSAGKETSGWAVASLVLGILSFACLPVVGAILALVFGVVGKRSIRESGGSRGGSGLATAGMALGGINLLAMLLLMAVLLPWAILNLGKTHTVTRTINAQGAESAVCQLQQYKGGLTVEGGADALFEGYFSYTIRDWEPVVDYGVYGGQGRIEVRQGGEERIPVFWFIHNQWNIYLNDAMPLDLEARLAGADGQFNMGSLSLLSLEVDSSSGDIGVDLSGDKLLLRRVTIVQDSGDTILNMRGKYGTDIQMDLESGSGDISLNLYGDWGSALNADITNHSGDISLQLPSQVGVLVRAKVSSGDITAPGMKLQSQGEDGFLYVNDAFGESPITLQINVSTSHGDIVARVH